MVFNGFFGNYSHGGYISPIPLPHMVWNVLSGTFTDTTHELRNGSVINNSEFPSSSDYRSYGANKNIIQNMYDTEPVDSKSEITTQTLLDGTTAGYVLKVTDYSYMNIKDRGTGSTDSNANAVASYSVMFVIKNVDPLSGGGYDEERDRLVSLWGDKIISVQIGSPTSGNYPIILTHADHERDESYELLGSSRNASPPRYWQDQSFNMVVFTRSQDLKTYSVYLNGNFCCSHTYSSASHTDIPRESNYIDSGDPNRINFRMFRDITDPQKQHCIQDLKLWSQTLTASEVATLYNEYTTMDIHNNAAPYELTSYS